MNVIALSGHNFQKRNGMKHVHCKLRECGCDVEEDLEHKQILQPRSCLFHTLVRCKDVDVSSESIGDLCEPDQCRKIDFSDSGTKTHAPTKKRIQHTFEKTYILQPRLLVEVRYSSVLVTRAKTTKRSSH